MAAPPIVLELKPLPTIQDMEIAADNTRYSVLVNNRAGFDHMYPATAIRIAWHPEGMGSVFSAIFDFIASIVEAIIGYVVAIISTIILLFTNPMAAIKKIFQALIDLFTGKLFLDFLSSFPLTRWLYLGIDHLTGGFLENLRTLTSLPGRFLTGQAIPRSDLIKALGVLVVILTFAVAVLTAGAIIAVIGVSTQLLKAGPLGKTALGRTLLDICAIGAAAVAGGTNLIDAFADAGEKWLEHTAIGKIAERSGVSGFIIGGAVKGTKYLYGEVAGDDDEEDDGDDSSDEETEDESGVPSSVQPATPAAVATTETSEEVEVPDASDAGDAGDEVSDEADSEEEADGSSDEEDASPDVEEHNKYLNEVNALKAAAAATNLAKEKMIEADKKAAAEAAAKARAERAANAATVKAARIAAQASALSSAKAAVASANAAIKTAKTAISSLTYRASSQATLLSVNAAKDSQRAYQKTVDSAKIARTTSATKYEASAKLAASKAVTAAKKAIASTAKKKPRSKS